MNPIQKSSMQDIFLSVVTRTQGKRMSELTDVFDCMESQSCQDFEFLVVGHKLTPEAKEGIEALIESRPVPFREKTRLIEVNHGGRTTPLNEGFAAARGRYIAILDDDDLMYENWISTFFALAKENTGKVLHAFGHLQVWESTMDEGGETLRRPKESVSDEYCVDFDLLDQLAGNRCPPFTLAFPSECFHKRDIRFDEALSTYEDWDYLMRTARVCGVANAQIPTGLYRIWQNGENSLTAHSQDEWKTNFETIKAKLASEPLTLSSSEVKALIHRMSIYRELERLTGMLPEAYAAELASGGATRLEAAKLYIDTGAGFSEDRVLRGSLILDENHFRLEYGELSKFGKPARFRWDPTENKPLYIENIEVSYIFTNRTTSPVLPAKLRTNGVKFTNGIYLTKADPHIAFRAGKESAALLVISGTCRLTVPDSVLRGVRS